MFAVQSLQPVCRLQLSQTEPYQEAFNKLPGEFQSILQNVTRTLSAFCRTGSGLRLRTYQSQAAEAILRSVRGGLGLSFVVMFPRQSGKNFVQAQLEAFLMANLSDEGAEIVKFSPTLFPQAKNAMDRLETALEASIFTRGTWKKSAGNHYRVGRANMRFLSGAPESNVVGATASTLLELDEAQDISCEKYDKQIAPMAASTNATRVFWGTAWTNQTLLARELRAAQAAEAKDGQKRVFWVSAEEVRKEVPAYGNHVDEVVARLGRFHPSVRSQYFGEEIAGAGSLFNESRLSLMAGAHASKAYPEPGKAYAMLVDLAGEDEANRESPSGESLENPGRDSTAVTIVEVDTAWVSDEIIGRPRYRVVCRYLWAGERHISTLGKLLSISDHWQAHFVVVDASGVGAGVASLLRDRLGNRVIPVVFNTASKSQLGWDFLSVIDTGRFQDFKPGIEGNSQQEKQLRLKALFERQLQGCQYKTSIGPGHLLHWGVPEGSRDEQAGGALHDDLLLSAALVARLDGLHWAAPQQSFTVPAPDPIREMEGIYA